MPKKKKKGKGVQRGKGNDKLSEEALEALAATFRILGESVRLSLIQELKRQERTVGELVLLTGVGQASVSKHLKVLHEGHFLKRRKDGVRVYYSVKGDFVFSLCQIVCQRLADEQQAREKIEFIL